MPVIDLNSTAAGSGDIPALRSCDVCVVGTGPAGATLAAELSNSQMTVTVLESGGVERDRATDRLNDVENIGRPRVEDQWGVRNRILGGSSHTWGGRCAGFDDIDFELRPWIDGSGWPFHRADLAPFLHRSAAHLGLAVGDGFSDERFWALASRPAPSQEPDPKELISFFWQFSRDPEEAYPYEYMRFGRSLERRMGPNVTMVTGATVLRVEPSESGKRVRSVIFAGPDGSPRVITASIVVLCTGGIENARILLASDSVTQRGLGNDNDLVGRYLMDHPRGPVGSFAVQGSEALMKRLGRYNVRGHLFRGGFRLSPAVQREEGLLNCAAWIGEELAPDDPWVSLRRLAGRGPTTLKDVRTVASSPGFMIKGARDYFVERNGFPRKYSALNLVAMCEQQPDPDSRVMLSERRDRFGVRLPVVDWRVHPNEGRTMRRMAGIVAQQLPRLGLPAPVLAEWVRDGADLPPSFVDVAHPTGTTRLAASADHGVVDPDLQVHGVEGLYVVGSSVFPTAGHCNPTQMIVALAIRLADKLKADAARPATPVAPELELASLDKRTVVVTGATGRIGQVVVADLLERGYPVRATTSRELSEQQARQGGVEWHHFDFLTASDADYDELLQGCGAVLHLGAEIGKMHRMNQVNVEATRMLAQASERGDIDVFCFTSSVVVYGSGRQRVMNEDAPLLTVDRDKRSEYWALEYVRAYGRTKVAAERELERAANRLPYVVLRPTVVVGVDDLIGIRDWNPIKRALASHRHAHHIYVRDVSDALIWAMEQGLTGRWQRGSVHTFNLSEDEFPEPTHADFLRKASQASADPRYKVITVPGIADWAHDFARFRTLPLRNPLWRMRFPSDKLRSSGYRHRFGMATAHALALERLRAEGSD